MKTAIFGGTFDPPHCEHIGAARAALRELKLDKLIVMPTYKPPHKAYGTQAAAEDRLQMARLAFGDERVEVSADEISAGGTSYSYITAENCKKAHPDGELYFIVGADMLKDFKTWKEPERILAAAKLAVFGRRGCKIDFATEREYFRRRFGKDFIMLDFVGENVSSTKIRVYTAFGLPTEKLLTPEVGAYIKEKGIYAANAYVEAVCSILPYKRLVHTADVVVCALKKVRELGLDREAVYTACTLHDVAKYFDRAMFPEAQIPSDLPKPVVHAFLGEYFARVKLGVTDRDVLNAIKYHTSGRPGMSALEKLVFVADMIAEGRDYEGVDKLRALYEEDFAACFRACLEEETIHLKKKGAKIYAETLKAHEYYVVKGEN